MLDSPAATKGQGAVVACWRELSEMLDGYWRGNVLVRDCRKTKFHVGRTFSRTLYIHLLYGSSANACWTVAIAPSMSSSFIKDTSRSDIVTAAEPVNPVKFKQLRCVRNKGNEGR